MGPRKAVEASNQRSIPRLRRKKRGDPSYIEGKPSRDSGKSLEEEEVAKRLASRPTRRKQADPTYIEEPSPTTSIIPLEAERTTEVAVELRSSSRERRLTEAEERELEVFDPAWKQFNDDETFEPTSNFSNESLTRNMSPPERAFKEELDGDGVGEVAAPSSALSSRLLGRFRLADAVVSVSDRLGRGSDSISRIGSIAMKEIYGIAKSSRRRLQLGGRCILGVSTGNLAILALGICAALILFPPIVALVWKSAGIDTDYLSRVSPKLKTVDALGAFVRGQQWARNKLPVIQQGRRFMTDDKNIGKSTIFDRLIHHNYTCLQLQQLSDPVLEDKMALSEIHWRMIKRISDRICEQVQEIPNGLIEYYSNIRFNATDVYNRVRYIRNVSEEREKMWTSGKQTIDATGLRQRMLSEAIPLWQKKFAFLRTQGARLLQRLTDLQVDLSALKQTLNSAELEIVVERAKAIKELPWDRRFAVWTGISWSEPRESSGYTEASTLIGRWYSEASSLENVLSEIYFEAEDLDESIRDLVRKRMSLIRNRHGMVQIHQKS